MSPPEMREEAALLGNVWPGGAIPRVSLKEDFTPSLRAQRHEALLRHALKKYKKYHGKQKIDDITVTDSLGYDWIELPVNEIIAGELDYMYTFPGPAGQAISDGVAAVMRAMSGAGGGGGGLGLMHELGLGKGPRDEQFNSDMDMYGSIKKRVLTLTQLVKDNPHIRWLKRYQDEVIAFWNTKTEWTARADEMVGKVLDLSDAKQQSLFRFALDVTVESVRKSRRLTDEELREINERPENQNGPDALEVYEQIDDLFQLALTELYDVMVEIRRHNFGDNEVAFRESVRKLDEDFAKMRDQNFFPLTRFGDKYVVVKATAITQRDGITYEPGDVMELRTWEGVFAGRKQQAFLRQKQREARSGVAQDAYAGTFTDEVRQTIGLPPSAVSLLRSTMELTDEQKTTLGDLVTQLNPSTSFLRHMVERKATPGFSMDGLRGLAEYFQKFSNYIAREKHQIALNDIIAEGRGNVIDIQGGFRSAVKREEILSHVKRHMEYLYNPGEEAAGLRAAAFTWYLGFVPKSALVNLTQPLVVGYPYLAAKYGAAVTGDVRAALGLSKGYADLFADVVQAVMAKTAKDSTDSLIKATGKNPPLEPWVSELVSRGVVENFLDESFATELAGVAEGNVISQLTPGTKVGRLSRKAGRWAAWMFQNAEKLNRRVMFIADVRLAFARAAQGRTWEQLTPQEREGVFQSGAEAVRSTMYEYARWNRPEIMRGPIKSTVFTFYMFLQNTLWFAAKEPGRGRFWLMMALIAGWSGLPGAEDITKLLDAVLTQYPGLRKLLGLSDSPMTDLKNEAREFIAEITDRETADLVTYGLGRKYGLGPLHLLQLLGAPVPDVDISRTMSVGQVVPAVPGAARGIAYGKDFQGVFQEAITDAAGASYGIPLMMLKAVGDWHPDSFKRWERAMPTAVKNAMKGWQWWRDEFATARNGDAIVEFDRENPAHFAEMIAATAGFQPYRLTAQQDMDWTVREHVAFYTARRTSLKQAYVWFTEIHPDAAAEKRVEENVRKYNSSAPKELRLTRAELRLAAVNKRIRQRKEAAGIPAQPRFIPEIRRLEGMFPQGGEGR